MVWRKTKEKLQNKNVKPTVKYDGESVTVWDYMSAQAVENYLFIDMDKHLYLSILKECGKMGMKSNGF